MGSDVVLVIVVATALAFDFTNGFHDTANAIATSVSTRAMSPRFAVLLSAVLNFAGAFISLKVAATVASGIVDPGAITTTVVFAGLIGAIAWNLATWWFGLPSSSSHALIGGVVGAAFAADGGAGREGAGRDRGGDDVRRVVKSVGEVERERGRHDYHQHYVAAHAPNSARFTRSSVTSS